MNATFDSAPPALRRFAGLTGGCQCGAIRYELTGEPVTLYLCHCTECQRQSSSAFGMSLTMPRDAVRVTRGRTRSWTRDADSGLAVDCLFCPDCGTRLFHDRPSVAATITVKPGTLDDRSLLEPVGHVWTASAQAWVRPWLAGDGRLDYPQQPPDKVALNAAWAGRTAESG